MLRYEYTGLPCPDRGAYDLSPANANVRKPTARGRSRNTLKDTYPTMRGTVNMIYTAAEMASWQHFWEAINHGTDWFLMYLIVYDADAEYQVHATGPFNAQNMGGNLWKVTLPIEVVVS